MKFIIIASLISFFGTFLVMPSVIKLAIKKRILTGGGGRNAHEGFTPNIGGIAIFIGLLLSNLFLLTFYIKQTSSQSPFLDLDSYEKFLSYIIVTVSCIIMFIIGLSDDLTSLSSKFRFIIQLIVAFCLTYYGDIRIESLNDLFGIHDISYLVSIIFSMIVVIFIINSFNLTDGLDSLATSLGIYILASFGILFLISNHFYDATLCFASLSSLFAFWFYNKPPAKIFMGDSGSLVIGLIIAYSAIKLCNFPIDTAGTINPVFILCVIAYPSIDTLRVFLVRISSGKSPFAADRNHIHHLLVDKDFNHGWASFFAVMYCIVLTLICFFIRENVTLSFLVMVSLAILFIVLPMASFARSTTKKFLSFFK
ncbi:undecaprenyl/decaprenyl-phosphate alpha-N-acetylglucosaminyl 1-phosphate transferase [bacterium]|nr:undecaprenyl/decaprenyl-phosphate alpha-N-acetylglucosaminyl 1-phosphate transferase [bacterium]